MKALPIVLLLILIGLNVQAWRGHPDMARGVMLITAIPMVLCVAWLYILWRGPRR